MKKTYKNIKNKLTKSGFTLIEVLSVIVIISIISAITIPIVINIISDAKNGAAKNSAYGLIKAANYYYQKTIMKEESERKFNGSTDVLPYLDVDGKKPDKGKVYINEDGDIALAVIYNKTCITKYFTTDLYESNDVENCGVYTDFTVPSSYVAFGGEYNDEFNEILKTSDNGYVAIGYANSSTYDILKSHGTNVNDDAIIVKYDHLGNVQWSKNFGGSGNDYYYSVIEEDNCYTVAGITNSTDGDLQGIADVAAIVIVKYDKNNGNIISKKVLFTSTSPITKYGVKSIIKHEKNYYVQLKGREIDSNYALCYVIKYDEEFNQIWIKHFNDRYGTADSMKMIKTTNNTLVLATTGQKNNGEVADIYIDGSTRFSAIFEISMEDGSILGKVSLGGNLTTDVYDIAETTDGYIIVGSSTSTTGNFVNLNKGSSDGYIAKIGKNIDSNGIFPIKWIKTFGGSSADNFRSALIDGESLIVAGYSYSSDYDMENKSISTVDAVIAKYDSSGNLVMTKIVGGSNTDKIYDVIMDESDYVIAGTFFSTNGDMQNFNYGNGDAVIMKLDNDFNTKVGFNIRPILLSKLPDFVVNYGENIPTVEDSDNLKLYTTNNPSKDLGGWCTSEINSDPNGNYHYTECLQPLNSADIKTIHSSTINLDNVINVNSDPNNWIKAFINFPNAGGNLQITNLKVKFKDKEAVTIKEAVDLNYIEPLVIIGIRKNGDFFFENSYNLLIEGNSGIGNFAGTYIMMKPKNIQLEQLLFNSNKATTITTQGFCTIYQYSNFDISLTQAK